MSQSLSRRDFLKKAGLGTAAWVAAETLIHNPAPVMASEAGPADEAWGMLVDLTRCVGCDSCALACKEYNQLAHPNNIPTKLDSDAYTYVADVEASNGETYHVKHSCMHCVHPACASACTVGALQKTAAGPVLYDADKCIGCRYCQYACPFGVPVYEWENPLGLISKCNLCVDRLAEGDKPACAAACPNGALRFGKRTKLLAQAHAQIASNPGRYVDHVFGEFEVGGTSIMYLSPVPFSELDFPQLGTEPVPHYAESVMTGTPVIALSVASVATALHLILRKRGHKTPDAIEVETGGQDDS